MSRQRRGDRRRARNFLNPTPETASDSVDEIIETARRVADSDHRESFVSIRERDLIASVYIRRAADRLADENE